MSAASLASNSSSHDAPRSSASTSLSAASASTGTSATPTRPARTARTFSIDGTPNGNRASAVFKATGAAQKTLNRRSLLMDDDLPLDADRTPRKANALPTPPNSETTSSGGGSVGSSARKPPPRMAVHDARTSSPVERRPSLSAAHLLASNAGGGLLDIPIDGSSPPASQRSLRHVSSTATIRTNDSREEARRKATPSAAAASPAAPEKGSLRDNGGVSETQRLRRSAMREQEISQLRSESRAGMRWGEDSDDEGVRPRETPAHSSPRRKSTAASSSRHATATPGGESSTATDTSGTEGAGSINSGRRRRKKSSATSASSRAAAARALAHGSGPTRKGSSSSITSPILRQGEEDWGPARSEFGSARRSIIGMRGGTEASSSERFNGGPSGSASLRSTRKLQAGPSSPFSEDVEGFSSPVGQAMTLGRATAKRSPLPSEFRMPAESSGSASASRRSSVASQRLRSRSNSLFDEHDADTSGEATYIDEAGSHFRNGGEADMATSPSETRAGASRNSYHRASGEQPRRKRYASDAGNSIPDFDYDGRAGTQGSRLSVDSSSASRHLARPRHSAQASLSYNAAPVQWDDNATGPLSPSEVVRQRKVSTSSISSQRSSGSASELLRSASRANARRHGRDVFDDGDRAPPMPAGGSGYAASATSSGDRASRNERLQALRQRQEQMRANGTGGESFMIELDDLRARIEELAVSGSQRSESRASSRTSSSIRPASTQTTRMYDALEGRIPSRAAPSTEPRRRATHERAVTLSELDTHDLSTRAMEHERDALSRARSRAVERRFASNEAPERAPMTPDMSSTGSQSAQLLSTNRFPSSSSDPAGPAHERNLHNAFSIFDKHFSGGPGTPSTPSRGADSSELVAKFKDVTTSAARINSDLRRVIQSTLEALIDAEMAEAGSQRPMSAVSAFSRIDKGLTAILRNSDEQLRSLTDGLIAFTRAERERDRMRKIMTSDNGSVGGRSASRMSSLGVQYTSPARPEKHELRSPMAVTASGRASPGGTVDSHASSERSGHSTARSTELNRHRRHATELASPSSADRSTGPTPSPFNSPTLHTAAPTARVRSMRATLSRTHSRAASEIFAGSPEANSEARRQRERSNASTVVGTIRGPDLSPRRAKLSFPSIDNATATAIANTSSAALSSATLPRSESPTGEELPDASLARTKEFRSDPRGLSHRASASMAAPPVPSRRNTVSSSLGYRSSRDLVRPPHHQLMQPDSPVEEEAPSRSPSSAARVLSTLTRRTSKVGR